MTTRSQGRAALLPADLSTHDMRLVETMVLRRCAMYRKVFRGIAVGYPADALRLDAVARWIRSHRVTVDVRSADELRRAGSTGIMAPQIVLHCAGVPTAPVHCAVNIGVGRFCIESVDEVSKLATAMGRTRQVVVDITSPDAESLTAEVAEQRRLNLIGFHYRLTGADDVVDVIRGIVARMSRLRREHGVLLTRISLADFDGGKYPHDLRRVADAIDDAVEDGCICFRYPRPLITVSPSRAALLLDP
jgi:Pyridoxal-dependent decarboxylase, pyridoxal binding domain